MRTFSDATPLLDEPVALRARMREQGYLFFRGLLDRDEVAGVARAALDALAGVGWVGKDSPVDNVRPLRGEPDEGADYERGIGAVQRIEGLHRLPHSPGLARVRRALLGADSFVHPAHVVRVVWPHTSDPHDDGSAADWIHQDYSILHVPDMFTAWYPLLDTPRDLGPLRVLAGSHRSGVIGRVWRSEAPGVRTDDERWASIDYRAGDVVVFHCLTAHTGMLNRTGRLRISCEARMQSTRHPVPSISLSPAVVQHWKVAPPLSSVPLAWDRLAESWSSREWYGYPDGINVFDHTDPEVADVTTHPRSEFVS